MWTSLIGFDGAGKRTLARLLARVSAREAVDLASDPRHLDDLPPGGDLVIATESGTIVRDGAADLLGARGLVVWLDAPWPVLRRRVLVAARARQSPWEPLDEASLRARYAAWRPLYARAARLRLDCDRHAPSALTRRLLARRLQLGLPAA
jgi:shikimate kinase